MRKFSIRRAIIILSLVFIYSAAFCMVKIYAEKAILEDVTPPSNYPAVNLDNNSSNVVEEHEIAEKISDKIEMGGYDIFTPEATKVSEVTTVLTSETTPEESTTPPESTTEEPTTVPTTESTTAPSVTTVPTTTEPKTEEVTTTPEEEEEIITTTEDEDEYIEEDENEYIEDDDEEDVIEEDPNVTLSPEEIANQQAASSILEEILNGNIPDSNIQTPGYYPEDNLYSSNSYKNETLTVYNKKAGRYVTGNAFDIICGITFNEVGSSMNKEAIKAQAVAVYTYIKYYQAKGEIASLSMKDDPPQEIIDAVEAVDGLCMYYDGEPIMAAFSASTGGYSASSENVWGGVRPYLVSVKNDYDYLDSKHYGKVTTYTVDEVRKAIESNTNIKLSNNYSEWIKVVERVDTVYAGQISIDGHTKAVVAGKERDITGYVFRSYILGIRSTNFTVSYNDGVFTFVTYGYGHGVGMSQIGANLYATYGGYSFDQILHHYYTGIVIK